jgi:hypothetical protein
MDDVVAIARLIDALRPWREHLVIVGGWAHQLHRLHPWASPPAYLPLRTKDADVAFSLGAAPTGDIRAALKAAGFREVLSGDHHPPVAEYRLGGENEGFFAEFLAPLKGSGLRRNGTEDATVVRAGVTAQKLRHLDTLLEQPWTVRLPAKGDVPLGTPADVLIANPVSFIAQKLLIRKLRKPDKQAQDALYIHDTLELFARTRDELGRLWRQEIRTKLHPNTVREIERLHLEQFGSVTDVIRRAARMPVGRSLTPTLMQATCAYGLQEIFSAP